MTLVQLEYLVEIAKHGSFSIASKSCFVTQPTLSMQMSNLEKELGVLIFDRSKKPLLLTEVGKLILAQANVILKESRLMKEKVLEYKGEISGQLRLGILPTIAPYLLPLFIFSFTKKYPKVVLKTEELTTTEIIEKLAKDTLDAGIVATPLNEKGINEMPLFAERMYAYVSPKHPWIALRDICLDEVKSGELWLLKEEHCFRSQAIQVCATDEKELEDNFVFESGSLETLKRLVEEFNGLTILPELATLHLTAKQRKLLKPFRKKQPSRQISIITSRHYIKKHLITALKEEILKKTPAQILENQSPEIVPVVL